MMKAKRDNEKSDLPIDRLSKRAELENMSIDDLWLLHEEITKVLSDMITSEKLQLEKRLAVLDRGKNLGANGSARGYDEVKQRRSYPRVYPKYRNPLSPSETWSGRGKQPRWLVAAIKSGRKIEEFKIKDAARSKSGAVR